MSQNDFSVGNQSFPSFRADLNSALQALASNSSGATAPSTTYAYQTWYDTSTDTLNMRNGANDGWIELASFDQTSGRWLIVKDTGVNGSAIIPSGSTAQRDSTPSAGYLRQNSSTGFMEFYNGSSWVPLTGTTDTQTLTNKTLTSPVLDGGVTGSAIASQAEAEAGTATDQLMTPERVAQAIAALASGGTLEGPFRQATTSGSAFDWTGIPAGVKEIVLVLDGATLSGAGDMLVQLGTNAGLVTTGYNSTSYRGGAPDTSTAGMLIHLGSSGTRSCYITMSFHLTDDVNNAWNQSHNGTHGTDLETFGGGGVILPGLVDRLRLTRIGTDTFTAGAAAILYR